MDDAELFLCATDKDLIFQQTFYVSGLNTLLTLIDSSLAATCMYTLFRQKLCNVKLQYCY